MTDENGADEGMLVTDYWYEKPYTEKWRFDFVNEREVPPFSVSRFPYRLEDYINGLVDAGFRITRIQEPRPSLEQVAAHPDWETRLRNHVPLLLYVAAGKPASVR